jgi:two-component system, chemotaxis family, chemotaxis protein CheY
MNRPVMIIEDDPDIRAALADVIAEDGHETITAANGRDALEQLQTSAVAPCVIVLDLMMPVMDGWQFAAGLREVSAWASIPIVIVSAGDDVEGEARRLGARGHLRKPVDLDDLLATVLRCAGKLH